MPKTDLLKVQIIHLGGKKFLDLRRCIATPSGGIIPTSRGISIPIDKIDIVLEKAFSANGEANYVEL